MLAAALQVEQLKALFERLDPVHERLIADLEDIWSLTRGMIERQIAQIDKIDQSAAVADLGAYREMRAGLSRNVLTGPFSEWEAQRPYKRTLLAMETYHLSLAEHVAALPETILINGPRTVDLLGEHAPSGWTRRLARLRRKDRSFPLAAFIGQQLSQMSIARLKTVGEFLVPLALGIHQLRLNWDVARAALDARAAGDPDPAKMAAEWRKQYRASTSIIKHGGEALAAMRQWPAQTIEQISGNLLSQVVWGRRRQAPADQGRYDDCLAHWNAQLRAIETEVSLELAIEKAESRSLDLVSRTLENLRRERNDLIEELDEFIEWLKRQNVSQTGEEMPPPKRNWVPAATRLDEWENLLGAELETLPESVEIYREFKALPDQDLKKRIVLPREIARRAWQRTGRRHILQLLGEIEAANQRTVQSIESAREVVSYGFEEHAEPEANARIRGESLRNALSLLEHYRRETVEWQPEIDPRMARIMAGIITESRLILNRDRLGIFTHLVQQGFSRAFSSAGRQTESLGRDLVLRSVNKLEELLGEFLTYIGWKADVTEGEPEVIARSFLPDEYILDLNAKQLPAIYRRLFHFEPIQDPRFLIGREREMAAITEARRLWDAGRYVAVIVVGTRGSGKTSLLNCALKTTLTDLEVIRGEFNRRLTTEAEMIAYLAESFGLDDPQKLEGFLLERRRVIIFEELERTYLRKVGCFGAVRALQRLIAATCSTTLWIIVANRSAFRFLSNFVSLGKTFSHRINAANVSPEILRKAILLRHNLSGLRLNFAMPPEQNTWNRRMLRRMPGQTDPEKIFFDVLARETEGVFRAAFEIWMGYIDRIESGVLHMKPLISPDLGPVTGELDQQDLFSLAAILQHGSLTPHEHASIFLLNLDSSRAQMDQLVAREIIEPDPGRPGFRIRPEARRIVTETLYQHNLI